MTSSRSHRGLRALRDGRAERPAIALLLLAFALAAPPIATIARAADPGSPPAFGDGFWSKWGDGRAEIATYDLAFPRYGEIRHGTAVAVWVTETFSETDRVKADPGKHPATDEFPVMKLNLVQDFPTGIYDYNLMTSVFVGVAPSGGRPAGAVAKIAFSSQEWCGHVYHQIVPERRGARHVLHSYFDGEADGTTTERMPADGLFEDALFHWARGFAGPTLAPGESRSVSLLTSAERSRLAHVPSGAERATVARAAGAEEITVPAGTFLTEEWTAEVEGGRRWSFRVEKGGDHRIVLWTDSDGRRAELVAVSREKYWEMHGTGDVEALGRIGLEPRPPRTP